MATMTLVIYDIPDDRLRNRIAEVCKDYGLTRIQWSAFLGPLSQNRREELAQRLRRTLGRQTGSIHLYPLCERDLHLRVEIEGEGCEGYRQGVKPREQAYLIAGCSRQLRPEEAEPSKRAGQGAEAQPEGGAGEGAKRGVEGGAGQRAGEKNVKGKRAGEVK